MHSSQKIIIFMEFSSSLHYDIDFRKRGTFRPFCESVIKLLSQLKTDNKKSLVPRVQGIPLVLSPLTTMFYLKN